MNFQEYGFKEVKSDQSQTPQSNQRQWSTDAQPSKPKFNNDKRQDYTNGNQGNRFPNNATRFNSGSSYSNRSGWGANSSSANSNNPVVNRTNLPKYDFKERYKADEGPVELYLPFVATGPRDAPASALSKMISFIEELETLGYTLRNGGRDGAEDLFEKSVKRKEIHLPWKGFLDKDSKFTFTTDAARILASRFHPSYDNLKPVIQTFLATDVRMVMGKDLRSPALFLMVWSEDGAETLIEKTARTGNAGQAISVACALKIPIFNFGKSDAEQRLRTYLGTQTNVIEKSQSQQSTTQPEGNYDS